MPVRPAIPAPARTPDGGADTTDGTGRRAGAPPHPEGSVAGAGAGPADVTGCRTVRHPAGRTRAPGTGRRRVAAVGLFAALFAGVAVPPAVADVIRDRQWGLTALRAEEAWGTTRGEGITVAVLDTGVDGTHPDLDGQVLDGTDLVGMGAGRGDRTWARHGTAMAGIIAGHGHGTNRRQGVLGLAPAARILPVRVILEEGDPARAKARENKGGALAEGIRWAADHGAHVINLSLGDDSDAAHHEAAEDEAVQYALAKGVVVVASAGNGGENGDHASYPAAYPGVIAVTAVDRRGRKAPFSTRSWYATVSAPGVDVVIADPDRAYYEGWGTSAAAAYVSGAVALVRSAHPDLSPAQIKKLLEDTAANAPAGGRDDARGHGLVDPVAALRAAESLRPDAPTPAPVPYGQTYFGPGPEPVRPPERRSRLLAPAAAGGGLALLALAAVLGRRRAEDRVG
ncbi:type VII secretion-associated serine protease mycosin [Streptomyces sp. NPDC090022]|uniref:type VII secretion-associated serine protease mycosin n=1 Tax=Streptomyces sp. NPDC090022 TaxID=3365920 RepID=UPI0038298238